MKYIMLETEEGQKLPFLFPEAVNHDNMALFAAGLVKAQFKLPKEPKVVNAGFASVNDVRVFGKSESLGNLPSAPLDATRIIAGESVMYMPDAFLVPLAEKIEELAKADK